MATRIDTFLADTRPEYSRSAWQKLIKQGKITVNGIVVDAAKFEVTANDTVQAGLPKVAMQTKDFAVIFEDDDVIVINKPIGILTHAKGIFSDEFTVADFVRPMTSYNVDTNRPGIIHRLDRDTSGVLLCAKNEAAAKMLSKQFQRRTVQKIYYAVTEGVPKIEKANIDIPIGRDPKQPNRFRVDPNGKPAQTYYEVMKHKDDGAVVRLEPKTGRTHQLRVHLKYVDAPIKGDRVYGKKAERLYLHAYSLQITLPSGKNHIFTVDIPKEFGV